MELPLNGFETVFQPVAAPVRSEFLISPQIIVENSVRIFFGGSGMEFAQRAASQDVYL